MKTTHQDSIAEIIYNILKMPNHLREAFIRGNPFDKLLRSYSEFTSSGKPLYRNKRSINHYLFSLKAHAHFKKHKSLDGLHAEHEVPLSIVKQKLLNNKSLTLQMVKSYLYKNNKVVVITKAEQKLIDSTHKSSMPESGISRLDYHKVKTAAGTIHNTLKSIK